MNEEPSPRIGVVGLGNIGHHHAQRLQDIGVDLVGGMDIDAEARTTFAEEFGTAVYEDHKELLSLSDAVLVTTPNKFHEPYAIDALEAGCDVLVEKPLAHDLESANRIAAAARDATGFCMVGFHNRFAPPVEVIKGRQAEGYFGEVAHVEANYVRQRGIPGRGSWFTDKETAGGGALIDIGVHAVDLALYLLDFPEVLEVSGTTRSQFGTREDYAFIEMWGEDTGPGDFDVEDSASAFVRCADGRTISLEVAWAANRPDHQDFVVRGTEAGAVFERDTGGLRLYESGTAGADHLSSADIEVRKRDTMAAEQELFLSSVAAGEAPERNTVEQALAVQRVLEAIYRSSDTGRAIRIDELDAEAAVDGSAND